MNAIRIRRTIDSETLTIPELRGLIGREVEIIVLEEAPRFVTLETEATFLALAPKPTPEEREANLAALREMAKTDPTMSAFLEAVESQDYDVEAVIRARGLKRRPGMLLAGTGVLLRRRRILLARRASEG